MTRSHPIIALDNRRRSSHYADFHQAKKRFELDVYYTALRARDRRANLQSEKHRIDAMLEHKLFRPGTEVFLSARRDALANQIDTSLGRAVFVGAP